MNNSNKIYDLAIIGGGIIGTNLAYWYLESNPHKSVIILEQTCIGEGSSKYSAGFDAIEHPNYLLRDLAIRSRQLYNSLYAKISYKNFYRLKTYWIINQQRVNTFHHNFKTATADYSKLSHVSEQQELLQLFQIKSHHHILEDNSNGFTSPGELSKYIVNYLYNFPGFTHFVNSKVISFSIQEDFTILNLADSRKIFARSIVFATGPWSFISQLQQPLHSLNVKIKKIAALHINKQPSQSATAVVFYEDDTFFLPDLYNKRWLFSFTLNTWKELDLNDLILQPSELLEAKKQLSLNAPAFIPYIDGASIFYDAYRSQREPIIYKINCYPKILMITGCSGMGYRIAPALAQDTLAQLIAP